MSTETVGEGISYDEEGPAGPEFKMHQVSENAQRVARGQVTLDKLTWRVVRYSGSLFGIDPEASEFDDSPPANYHRSGKTKDYAIQTHIDKGNAKVIFEGSLVELSEKFSHNPRLDVLIDKFPHLREGYDTIRHFFQFKNLDGAWINYGKDPRPLSVDEITELLASFAKMNTKRNVWRGVAILFGILSLFLALYAFVPPHVPQILQ